MTASGASAGPGFGTLNPDYATRLATTPPSDDGPVWMLNLMQYRAVADYGPGSAEPERTGREADNAYLPLESLAGVGAAIVYMADVESQVVGEGEPWDRVAIVRFPTRRSFIDMQARDDFQAKYHHKEAGMERSTIIGCQPAGGSTGTPGASHQVLRVVRWSEVGAGPEPPTMVVEDVVVGDGRPWDALTIEAADDIAVEPNATATAEYVLMVRPEVDELAASFD